MGVRNSNHGRRKPHVAACGLVVLAALVGGCTQPTGEIFPKPETELVWPPAPNPPRIRYVGELRTAADLKPPAKPFERLGELLVGAKKPPSLYGPRSVLVTTDGSHVWIADPGGRCLHLFNLANRQYQKIERVGQAHLLSAVGLCFGPEDSLFVCDSEDVAIHQLSTTTGEWRRTLRLPEEIERPVALRFDAAAEELWVVDAGGHDLKILGPDDRLRRIVGRRGNRPGEFNFPCDIADDGDVLWVVDTGNHRVQGLTREGQPLVAFGQPGDAPGDMALPKSIAVDSDGHLYVVDARFENVQVFDRTGRLLLMFGEEGTGPGQFWLPAGIYIDGNDRIWICDAYNGRVQVFDYLKQPAASQPAAGDTPEPEPTERTTQREGDDDEVP